VISPRLRAGLPCQVCARRGYREADARREVIILITRVITMITWSDTSVTDGRSDRDDKVVGLKQIDGGGDVAARLGHR
jgi:hypothetical protein